MAETVAKEHTITELYIGSKKPSVKGKRNSMHPVALFKSVCMDMNLLQRINPQRIFPIFMLAIIKIQTHSQTGRCIKGSIFTKQTATNTMSAAVSNLAPNSLILFVFLAIVPSIASEKPQNRYMA